MYWIVLLTALLIWPSQVLADGGHDHHAVPTLKNQTTTVVTVTDNAVTLTFGPIDLPSGHEGDLAASMPKHIFQLPKDMYMVGFKSAVFTKEVPRLVGSALELSNSPLAVIAQNLIVLRASEHLGRVRRSIAR